MNDMHPDDLELLAQENHRNRTLRNDQAEPQLVTLVREIHAAVTAPQQRFAIQVKDDATDAEIAALRDGLRPGDIAYRESGAIVSVTTSGDPHDDKPSTPYGVRVFYDDGTMEEIHDIIGVQVANFIDGSFPVGFVRVEDSETGEPVPGRWNADGEYVPFDLPKDRPGW